MAISVRHDVGSLPGLHGTTFATRCGATSEAAWDSRAFNGDGHCWLSLRLSGHFSSRRNTVAQGWLQTLLCSACRAQSRCVAAGRCRGSWRRDVPAKILTEQGAAAHMSAELVWNWSGNDRLVCRSAMVAAVAQVYLGSMTFFAAREARAASGSGRGGENARKRSRTF